MKRNIKSGLITITSAEASPLQPCQTIKAMTIREALDQNLPLPWDGQVMIGRPEELTKELFSELEAIGMKRVQIRRMFGFKYDAVSYSHMKKIGVATKAEAAMAASGEIREEKVKTPFEFVTRNQEKATAESVVLTDKEAQALATATQISGPESDGPVVFAQTEPLGAKIPIDLSGVAQSERQNEVLFEEWEDVSALPKISKLPMINVRQSAVYLNRAACVMLGAISVQVRISPDGKQIAFKAGGQVRISKDGGEINSVALRKKLTEKKIPTPSSYVVEAHGEWLVGTLKAAG